MNKKIIFALSLVLLALLAVIGGTTYAWLPATGKKAINYEVGQVSYSIEATSSDTVVVPGDNLVSNVMIKNKSNVATEIRVKIEYSTTATELVDDVAKAIPMTLAKYTDNDKSNHLLYQLKADWSYAKEDNKEYFYYANEIAKAQNTTTGDTIEAPLENLILNGRVAGNSFAGATVTITLTFEVKQAANVEWSQMGSINFETGLPTA